MSRFSKKQAKLVLWTKVRPHNQVMTEEASKHVVYDIQYSVRITKEGTDLVRGRESNTDEKSP
jgi:hypothetical protein